jgi:transketolase
MKSFSDDLVDDLRVQANYLRRQSLTMIYHRQAGHPGGCLSAADIVAALYFNILRIDPGRPAWEDRDRFILSKGHASALLYSALASRGYFPQADLGHWGELGCHLQGHPDRLKTPGVDMTSGILGHGIAIGLGLSLAARLQQRDYYTYVLLGDGECQGGIVWEGANACAKYNPGNLIAIVDYNDVQLDGAVHDIMPMEPFADKWRSFRWEVIAIDGHDMRAILSSLEEARSIKDKPVVIMARTVKGKGVSFMENKAHWHGIPPNKEQYEAAMAELAGEIK